MYKFIYSFFFFNEFQFLKIQTYCEMIKKEMSLRKRFKFFMFSINNKNNSFLSHSNSEKEFDEKIFYSNKFLSFIHLCRIHHNVQT